MTLALRVRVEYANIDCEINQAEHSLSFIVVNLCLTDRIREDKLNLV